MHGNCDGQLTTNLPTKVTEIGVSSSCRLCNDDGDGSILNGRSIAISKNDNDVTEQSVAMNTKFDRLVTNDSPLDLLETYDTPLPSCQADILPVKPTDESILDLSQQPTTAEMTDPWRRDSTYPYTDSIDDDFERMSALNVNSNLNLNQSLTDQLKSNPITQRTLSDNSAPSQMDVQSTKRKNSSSSSSCIVLHELQSCADSSPSLSHFLWSNYLAFIGERSVSEEFFDHYLASIQSGLETDMKLEYCYDVQHDLYWLAQIKFVSYRLIRLHYLGIPEEDTSNDVWAHVYGQRCHPIGWCRENSKLMLPPPVLTKRAIQQAASNSNAASNGNDKQSIALKGENDGAYQTPPAYLFDQNIGVTPAEQLKTGMLLELQDLNHPWTLWFVRIICNRGGRLHLRYITKITGNNNDEEDEVEDDGGLSSSDMHLFYLDHHIHPVGWMSHDASVYSYDIPACLKVTVDKQEIIDLCVTQARTQFLPMNLFKEQHDISKHRFTEGMKLEIFDFDSHNTFIGRIGVIHNDYYFDVMIENDHEHERSFVSYSTDPRLLSVHWAAEHKLALMNGKSVRQSENYWNVYTEKHGLDDVAPECCFSLITLNTTGSNRVEPGMKMEMVYTVNNRDYVFSVTITHIVDHLMWLRVDDPSLLVSERLSYHVVPINSLDIFPVGWAKINGFELIAPLQYQMDVKTYEQNRYELFSSVTKYPRIPRVYLNDVYLLTVYVNARCFCGPHVCSSRLARIPSQFGPGPFRLVLIDMFHHLLSVLSTHAHRALRRLDHQVTSESKSHLQTEHIKSAKRFSKLIRPISIPTEPRAVRRYLRHVCTQLETCSNLLSVHRIDNHCPDNCHVLSNTFTFSIHSKHKRTQLRAAQNRHRKEKTLLGHLKSIALPSNLSSPVVEESPSLEMPVSTAGSNGTLPLPGSDRQTRGFRVHIEPKTHTVTRTNKKQKVINIKEEPVDIHQAIAEVSSTTTSPVFIPGSKRVRIPKRKPSLSPPVKREVPSPTTILKKNRRALPKSHSANGPTTKTDVQPSPVPIRPIPYPTPPAPIDPRNPLTWNVNDVCWYLNECGCSFALKTIREQEIDGAALLLIDDLDTVQDLLDFKLGPAVKFYHVVEQLRSQVIDTFHSSPSLKTSSRFSTH